MNTFVTGASGFLGTALTARLRAAGHEVIGISSRDCDLTIPTSLDRFNRHRFDLVIHLAAWTQAGDFCLHHPGEQWLINQKINTNVLFWCHSRQPQAKLVTMGTSCSYAPHLELREENYLLDLPIESLFTYAMTKRILYVGLRALEKQFGLKHLTFVPSTLYGSGYHTDGRQMHFIFDLIRKILRGKYCGEKVVLWGTGQQKRELVHVDDFVDAVLRLLSADNELINVGAGEEHSIREFAEIICEIVDFDPNRLKFDETRYEGAKSKCLDTSKLRAMLPDWNGRDLRTGLKDTVEWFKEDKNRWK